MPSFEGLPEEDRWQLVAYVKSLSPVFGEQPPAPVTLGRDPDEVGAELAKGRALYETMGCAVCHGASWRGNGPSAGSLVDDRGDAIRPTHLALPS